ncbi:MAG TPA: hypothetical protein VMM93_08195, partial [Vicinamibacterales bacterium]|nr:hypothetical protein [Vicinamibacterales bacterium]
ARGALRLGRRPAGGGGVTAGVAVRLQKELRTLVWPWAAAMAGLGLMALSQPMLVGFVAVPGALVLGAWAVGSEYSQRTLPGLLVQPIPRWQLGGEKLVVVLALIATLVVPAALSPLGWTFTGIVGLLAVFAASLAALLTLKTRTPRAGILFTVAARIVGALFIDRVPDLVAYASGEEPNRRWTPVALTFGTTAATAGVLALLVLTFGRLEAKEETHEHVSVVWRSTRPASDVTRPAHPLWALARKELALLQVLWLLSGLYVLGWMLIATQEVTMRPPMALSALMLNATFVALLGGAMTSAEERRLGLIPAQAVLPVSFARQWMVKVVVCFGLVLTLAIGLPVLLVWLLPLVADGHVQALTPLEAIGLILLATVAAIYVSSLARNSLLAFLAAFPVAWGVTLIAEMGISNLRRSLRGWPPRPALSAGAEVTIEALAVLVTAGFFVMLLAFAMRNHLAADRKARRLTVQGLAIFNYVIGGAMLLGFLSYALRG